MRTHQIDYYLSGGIKYKDTIWHQLEKLLSAVMLASARCTVSEKQCHHEVLANEKNIQWRKIMIENTSDEFLFKIFYHSMHCHFHTSFMIFWKLEIRKTSFHLLCHHSTSNLQLWRQTFACLKFWGDFTFTISSFLGIFNGENKRFSKSA